MTLTRSRRLLAPLAAALAVVALTAATASAEGIGPPATGFYVDGELYRTVATPTSLPDSAPDHSFDVIYDLGGEQTNVAEAKPGDPDYNGGRWMVHAISFTDYGAAVAAHDSNGSGDFDSAEEVEAAIDAGDATDNGVVARFVCPVIPMPRGGQN